MALKLITGQIARGEDTFYKRDNILNNIWDCIKSGSSVLIAAPRRVGKSSVMGYIEDNPEDGFIVLNEITESVDNENEFFKILTKKTIKELNTKFKHIVNNTKMLFLENLGRLDNINPKDLSFEFKSESGINYKKEFLKIIDRLEIGNKRIVFMIDEFAQTVENIKNNQNESAAIHFLQTSREIRQKYSRTNKLQFVYAGSIGLENIVSLLNSVNLINDLDRVQMPPLNEKQANEFIIELTENLMFSLSKNKIKHIIDKIEWLIPFYIQLIISELNKFSTEENKKIFTISEIDNAFSRVIDKRNYFEHWFARLKKIFKNNELQFAIEILNIICEKDKIDKKEVIDLSIKYKTEECFRNIINTLKYDGYISNSGNNELKFNSPILKMWWCENVKNY